MNKERTLRRGDQGPPRRVTEEFALPGGGLTRQERRQIALGPADSLRYAEIARRLGRPTSTITREDAQRRPDHLPRRPGPPRHRTPYPPAQARILARAGVGPRAAWTRRRGPGRVRGEVHRRPHGFGPHEDGGPGADLSVHHRRGQPHRVPTRPAPPGQPGVRLQGDRLPGEPEPRPPGRDERRHDRYVVDDELFCLATIAGARSNDQLVETALRGVSVLGLHTPAATRLANIARFLDLIGESVTRAAEQAHEVLHTAAATTSNDTARPGPDPDSGPPRSSQP